MSDRALTWTVVAAFGALMGGFVFLAMPKPSAASEVASLTEQQEAQKAVSAAATARLASVEASIALFTWTESADAVESKALALVTEYARSNGVRVVAFRPQRGTASKGLTAQPFLVAVEGRFPSVASLAAKLGTPSTRLAVNLIQVANADPNSDLVTATLGLVAYRRAALQPGS